MEVGCSMLNLLKGAELKLAQKKHVEAKKKKIVLARGQISVSAFKEVFYGRGEVIFMGESQNFKYISCPITS